MRELIYLDNAATSHPKPASVYLAAVAAMRGGGSPGRGSHRLGRQADRLVYEARERLAAFLGVADAARLIFQPGATQSINTALFGLVAAGQRIVTTAVEHNAVLRPLRQLERTRNVHIATCGCVEHGRLDMQEFEERCRHADVAVVTHASNVTGVVFDLKRIAAIAARNAVKLIVDASQTVGYEDINVDELGIAALCGSGHKGLMGVPGVGALALGKGINLQPLVFGGTGSMSENADMPQFLPDALESGTMNAPAIAALSAGVQYIQSTGMKNIKNAKLNLSDKLREDLAALRNVTVHGATINDARTGVVCITMHGLDCGEIAARLDEEHGIAVRAGVHCSPAAHRVLGTINTGAVRFSVGCFNNESDIDCAVSALKNILDD